MSSLIETPSAKTAASAAPDGSRRGFLARLVAIVVAAALYVPALAAGALAFLNPLRIKSEGGKRIRLTTLDMLPADGTPQRFPVIADRSDAWTFYPNEPIGAVWLRLTDAKQKKVQAVQVLCPHLGCYVDFRTADKTFFCPCHRASFDMEGKRTEERSMSPRDLDTLDVEIRNGNEVWVNYLKFRTGSSEKIVEA
jgi:menaquinol-cytochrome c reductase iron-sulfur subunit